MILNFLWVVKNDLHYSQIINNNNNNSLFSLFVQYNRYFILLLLLILREKRHVLYPLWVYVVTSDSRVRLNDEDKIKVATKMKRI